MAADDAAANWRVSHSQQRTICRQCTTCVLCGCCLSQFQISFFFRTLASAVSVCVSLRQYWPSHKQSSRCKLSVQKNRTAACSYTEQPRESCTATQQIFNTATAQRPHEAMQVSIQICSCDTGICCRRISIEYQTSSHQLRRIFAFL